MKVAAGSGSRVSIGRIAFYVIIALVAICVLRGVYGCIQQNQENEAYKAAHPDVSSEYVATWDVVFEDYLAAKANGKVAKVCVYVDTDKIEEHGGLFYLDGEKYVGDYWYAFAFTSLPSKSGYYYTTSVCKLGYHNGREQVYLNVDDYEFLSKEKPVSAEDKEREVAAAVARDEANNNKNKNKYSSASGSRPDM